MTTVLTPSLLRSVDVSEYKQHCRCWLWGHLKANCSFVPLPLVHSGLLAFLTQCTDLCLFSVISSSSFYISASEILVPQGDRFATTWVSLYVSVFISREGHLGHGFRTFYFLSCLPFKLSGEKWYSSFLWNSDEGEEKTIEQLQAHGWGEASQG